MSRYKGILPASVTVAESAGFCFGVRRATEAVERLLESYDGKIYTLGRLIHNDGYVAHLKEKGVGEINGDDIPRVCDEAKAGKAVTVVIRAHGETRENLDALGKCAAEYPNLHVLDCTCPYVNKVRRIAGEASGDGKLFVLIGAEEHPEVRGIMSCTAGEGHVFPDADSLSAWLSEKAPSPDKIHLSVAAQTTQKLTEWKKCLEILKKQFTNAEIFDTICKVTEERQREARSLAQNSDVMLVIGSSGSSNTVKLYEICKSLCERTYLVEDVEHTGDVVVRDGDKLSITAGASTPYSVIQEVEKAMKENESFEELLDQSIKTLNTGDVVVGIVTSVNGNEITLDLGAKATGIITADQITDDSSANLKEMFKIGDEVEAFVIKVSDIDGIATLSKKRVDSDRNWETIVAAAESGEILEGKILEAVKGGVIASVNSVRVFIPGSHTGVPKDGDLSALVGTTQKFKIIEIKADRHRAYGSIRSVLRDERSAKRKEFWENIAVGQEFDGEIRSLESYGAFVDLGGVDGLVHVTELSWKRIKHPSEVVKVGDTIHVFVKDVDVEKKRISLGYKTEESNPWTIFTNKYAEGDVADVKIVSLTSFGAFAEVVPGVDGLIHISQIADHRVGAASEVLTVGDQVQAKIVGIDNDKHKVSLSIRALIEPAAPAAEEAAEEVVEDAAPAVYSTDDPSTYANFEGETPADEQ